MKPHLLTTTSISVIALMAASAAVAQDQTSEATVATPVAADQARPAAGRDDTTEVVVTARKRAEAVQDIPLSVTAVSPATLRAKAIVSVEQLTAVTSGVQVLRNANNVPTFRIRGLGTGGGSDAFEQSVAMFLDGSYVGRAAEFNAPMFDVERVEVIKGTQAALLAKNTSLGAISITTRKPTDQLGFDFAAQREFEYGSRVFDAGVNVPITDTFKVRLSGQSNVQVGPVRNTLLGVTNETKATAGRIVAVWTPTDNFNATLMHQEYDVSTEGAQTEVYTDRLGVYAGRAALQGVIADTKLDYKNQINGALVGGNVDDTTGRRSVLTLNYDYGDLTFTSVTAASKYDQKRAFDTDEGPGRYTDQPELDNGNEVISQEFRVTSPADDRFNYVAGLYFQNEKWYINRTTLVFRDFLPGGSPIAGSAIETYDLDTDTLSAFGQGNFNFSDKLTGSLGLRVTNEKREAVISRNPVPGFPIGLYNTLLYPTIAKGSPEGIDDTTIDGSVGLQYKFAPKSMLFASYSRGTKGAAYLSQPTNLATATAPKEQADSYELGAKVDVGIGFVNATLFHTKITDLQQALYNGLTFDTTPYDVISKGVEMETNLRLNDYWRVMGTVTYLDAKYDTNKNPVANGSVPLNTPKWSGNATLQYKTDISDNYSFTGELNVEHQSQVVWMLYNQAECKGSTAANIVPCTDPYTKLNARLSLANLEQDWDVSLIARNLTDEHTIAYGRASTFINGVSQAALAPPRMVILQFTIRR